MYEYQAVIGSSRVGEDGKLTVGAALDYMQDCEWFDIVGEPEAAAHFEQNGVGMFVVFRQIDLIRMPLFSERIEVRTWAYDCTRLLGFRNTLICDSAGEACVASHSIGSFVEKKHGRSTRVPQAVADSIFKDERFPMEYLSRKISLPDSGGKTLTPEWVRRYHIDNNRHMNNARYVEIAEDCLPEDFSYDQIRVEYKTPARRGDQITPELFCVDGWERMAKSGGAEGSEPSKNMEGGKADQGGSKRIVSLRDQENRVNAVIEFGRMNRDR